MKRLLLLTAFVIAPFAHAQDMSLSGVEKVIIVSPFAHVSLTHGPTPFLRATGANQISWSARMDGKILRLTGSASSGAKANPAVKVEVMGPGVPVEIHLQEGQVTGAKWSQPLVVDILKGKLVLKDGSSSVTGLVQIGSATLTDHKGTSRLELFRGDVGVKNYTGDLDVSGFKVDVTADKFQGFLTLNQHQGGNKVTNSSGAIRFDNTKATLASLKFNGRVEGRTTEGYVNIQAGKVTEIEVKTQSGKISVSAPGSGAIVNAHNEEGDIQGPASLKVQKEKGARVLRGRLKGANQGGRIELTSLSGSLIIRE